MIAERVTLSQNEAQRTLNCKRIEGSRDCQLRTKSTLFLRNGLLKQGISTPVLIAINYQNLNFYTIQNRKSKFLGQRKIILPIDARISEHIETSNRLILVVEKNKIDRSTRSLEFAEQRKIDLENYRKNLLFTLCFSVGGLNSPVEAEYLGEYSHYMGFGKPAEWYLYHILDNSGPVFRSELALAELKEATDQEIQSTNEHKNEISNFYLGYFQKSSPGLIKPIFRFNLNYSKNDLRRKKLKNDKKLIPKSVRKMIKFKFYPKKLIMPAGNLGQKSRHKEFLKFSEKMLVVGVMELRTKKVLKRAFVSLHELFYQADCSRFRKIKNISPKFYHYDAKLDLLILDCQFDYARAERHSDSDLSSGDSDGSISMPAMAKTKKGVNGFRLKLKASGAASCRFEVFGVLGGAERKVSLRPTKKFDQHMIGPAVGGQLLIVVDDRTTNEFRVELKEKNLKIVEKSLRNRRTVGSDERRRRKVLGVKSRAECSTKLFDFTKEGVLAKYGISVSGFLTVEIIDHETILMVDWRYLLLIDSKTGDIVSWIKYSENFTACHESIEIDEKEGLMVVLNHCQKLFDIYELDQTPNSLNWHQGAQNSVSIKNLFSYDLKQELRLGYISGFRAFRQIEEGVYQLFLVANFREEGSRRLLNKVVLITIKMNKKDEKIVENQVFEDSSKMVVEGESDQNELKRSFSFEKTTLSDLPGYTFHICSNPLKEVVFRDGLWSLILIDEKHNKRVEIKQLSTENEVIRNKTFSVNQKLVGFEFSMVTNATYHRNNLYLTCFDIKKERTRNNGRNGGEGAEDPDQRQNRASRTAELVKVGFGGIDLFEFDEHSEDHFSRISLRSKTFTRNAEIKWFFGESEKFKIICLDEDRESSIVSILNDQLEILTEVECTGYLGGSIFDQGYITFQEDRLQHLRAKEQEKSAKKLKKIEKLQIGISRGESGEHEQNQPEIENFGQNDHGEGSTGTFIFDIEKYSTARLADQNGVSLKVDPLLYSSNTFICLEGIEGGNRFFDSIYLSSQFQ